ncbi:glycosyltransferase family 4 protein [Parapedobacter sp. SGR-10]|uniref:glycosyltransferase family 4 protein n=1 Tax=Parapedobacter sp. SGR-10 TaxID=2710879 RepID=UPI0013CFFD36|nr:glycosyltransferase family 4 protein [Parapedobacter sp. SGR-10]NGF58068.1 glycosyltransferase family 4 protein [Parapedobacter sp. SGR-10]
MRILIVHNFYQHHGGEDVVFEQEMKLLATRHDVKSVRLRNKKGWKGVLQYLFYPWNIFSAQKVLKEVKSFAPDIVHVHNTHYAIGPLLFRSLYKRKVPVVQTLHNFRILDPSAILFHKGKVFTDTITKEFPWKSVRNKVLDNSWIKTFLTAFTYYFHKKIGTWQHVDKFLVFSEFAKGLLLQSSLRLASNQIAVKPNFVYPIVQQTAHTRENYFVYIGRLSVEKGITPMLEAFAESGLVLKIYGTGPLQDTVKKYVHLHTNIEYYGFQPKEVLHETLSCSQALIMPSVCFEGMPMTILDAFASGTPVIASKIGILSEMVQPGKNGLHIEPNDKNSLIQALYNWQYLRLEEKKQMSENCKNEYWEKYSPEKNVSLLERIYQEVKINQQ